MGRPKVYEHSIRVDPADIDGLGHVNNVVYLRYAQDVAVAHWRSATAGVEVEHLTWVARRHEIDYLKPAFHGDALLARTWVGESTGATFERHIEIRRPSDESLIARVRSVWVALDSRTMRPRRVTDALRAPFEEPDPAA